MKREATLLLAVVVVCLCGTAAAADRGPEGRPADEAAAMIAKEEAARQAAIKEMEERERLDAIKQMKAEEYALRKAMIKQAEESRAALRPGLTAEEQRALAELRELAGGGPGNAPRVVLVPAGEMEPERAELLVEDLAIMSRVLDKALAQALGEGQVRQAVSDPFFDPGAFLQPVFTSESDRPKQTLYLDGYGAVFLLNVRFPLIGPATAKPQEPEKEPESLWEQTKREMQRPRRETSPSFAPGAGPSGYERNPYGPRFGPAFRPERVERLREALLDSLREATHVRGLEPDEAVAIVVVGSSPVQEGFAPRPPAGVLTVHVRKADIDACAEEELPAEEFRKRVTIVIR